MFFLSGCSYYPVPLSLFEIWRQRKVREKQRKGREEKGKTDGDKRGLREKSEGYRGTGYIV